MNPYKFTQQLPNWDRRYLWHPFTQMKDWETTSPIIIEYGDGPYLIDTQGRRYLDGTSSLWVNVHGHRHPTIDQAIIHQLKKVAHTTLLGLSNPPAILLARELVRMAPTGLTRVFYSDDGSTAMEVALKMAIQYWRQRLPPKKRKTKFVHLVLSYHGDTIGGMSLGGVENFRAPFRSLLFKTHRIDPPYCYRCPLHLKFPACHFACLDALESVLQKKNHEIAGVVLEPMMQGVAGMIPSPPGYLTRVRKACSKYQVLLIADEVATGFGRTGRMFACQHESVTPDLMAVAKGLTGGYLPLAATLATDEIYQAFLGKYEEWKTFFHGHSYTGNPLGCVAALATIQIFKTERTLATVKRRIVILRRILDSLSHAPFVGDIRQCGLMVGIELVKDPVKKTPFPLTDQMGDRVAMEARKRGLMIRPIGNVLVLMPPLCSKTSHLKAMVSIVEQSLCCLADSLLNEGSLKQ